MNSWRITSIGNAKGSVFFDGKQNTLCPGCGDSAAEEAGNGGIVFDSVGGKIADSEDSFLFYYTKIRPAQENFRLEARFTVLKSDHVPDFQTGYGIAAVDTVSSPDRNSKFRNQLETGRFRTSGGFQHAAGVRVVAGYTDVDAFNQFGRVLDSSIRFTDQKKNDRIEPGDSAFFAVEKTDEGFLLICNGETVFFPGHDFLCHQEKEGMYAGFFAAGKVTVKVNEIAFSKRPGTVAQVPPGTIRSRVMDYPYERTLSGSCMPVDDFLANYCRKNDRNEYILTKGVYRLPRAIIIPIEKRGLIIKGETPGKTVLDGFAIKEKVPLFIVRGTDCVLEGIVFQNSRSCGLHICGSGNTIKKCEARNNGDTGILICAFPGETKETWPCGNRILDCVSHDNCDTAGNNADGFGAKLGIGPGNEFLRCISHHNVDDGFDLFTKAYLGPVSPVRLTDCTAFRNGILSDRSFRRKYSGSGFKLGGENIGVKHIVCGCRAFRNNGPGFNRNTNPFPEFVKCREWFNHIGRQSRKELKTMVRNAMDPAYRKRSQLPDNRNRKNIMFLIPALYNGGAERVTVRLANALSKKYNVSITYYDDIKSDYETEETVNVVALHGKKTRRLFVARVARKIFRKFKAESMIDGVCREFDKKRIISIVQQKVEELNIHTVISMLDFPNMVNAGLHVPRKIMSERNDPSKVGEKYFAMEKESFAAADAVVFQSEHVKEMFDQEIRKKSRVILNPVSMPLKAEKHTPGKIVSVGRLHRQKNQKLLIESFFSFHQTHPGYCLYIYGRGELGKELKALVKKRKLEDFVFFPGYCDNIYEKIKDAEFFVLSSDYEGLSNSLMEALAMGIPCITTDCSGARELITDGENGLIVPTGDKAALADAMGKLADDAERRSLFSENSVIRARNFSVEEIAKQWEEIL